MQALRRNDLPSQVNDGLKPPQKVCRELAVTVKGPNSTNSLGRVCNEVACSFFNLNLVLENIHHHTKCKVVSAKRTAIRESRYSVVSPSRVIFQAYATFAPPSMSQVQEVS